MEFEYWLNSCNYTAHFRRVFFFFSFLFGKNKTKQAAELWDMYNVNL